MAILKRSMHRQKPPCPHYDVCGNCTLQHSQEGLYRQWKSFLVQDALLQQGLRPDTWENPVFMTNGLRRRATFSVYKPNRQGTVMGYYRRRSHFISEINSCLILEPALIAMKERIKPYFEKFLSPQNSADVFLQLINNRTQMIVTGVLGKQKSLTPEIRHQLEDMAKTLRISQIGWRESYENGIQILVNFEPLPVTFGPLRLNLPLGSFLQPTELGEKALIAAIMKAFPVLTKKPTIADLFSGCGTFSGPLLLRGSVDAYDSDAQSIKRLGTAGFGRGLHAFCRDLMSHPLTKKELNRYEFIVFDPPRMGSAKQARELAHAKSKKIVGVSCNPETFARDARILCNGNFRLLSVQLFDQFRWSHHVELVGVFENRVV